MIHRSVSHYKIVERLGAGGMGEIYKAQDVRLNRTVAVKMVTAASSADAEKRQRFLQEARAASGLNHPNIITVHDLVSDNDAEFLVMEFIAGQTLGEMIRAGGIPSNLVVDYALQISDALAAAHAAGIIHRDIKPGNVMVTPNGHVKVLDFGLAKLTSAGPIETNSSDSGDESTRTVITAMTVEGSILGTVSYMSPEQAEGKAVDGRSDIFAFGAMLYEMITGEKAFKGQSALATLSAILRDEVRPIQELAPATPPGLAQITLRCLAKRPEDRWQTMREVNTELRHLRELSDTARMSASLLGPRPVPRRNPKWINAVAIVLPALVLLGVFWWLSNRNSGPAIEKQVVAPTESVAEVKPAEDSLNNDGVIEMVRAKVPTSVIVSHVKTAPFTSFDVSTNELIRLGKEGVPEPVIQAMSSRWRLTPPPGQKPALPAGAAMPVGQPTAPGEAPPVGVVPVPPAAPTADEPKAPALQLRNGTPFEVLLTQGIPEEAPAGMVLSFAAKSDFRVDGVVVIPAGTQVRGEIVESGRRRFPGLGGKLEFRILDALTPGGQVKLRALPGSQGNDSRRTVAIGGAKPSRGMAADAGALYIAYIDGDQTVRPAR
jgi:serine/threonine protein kinase